MTATRQHPSRWESGSRQFKAGVGQDRVRKAVLKFEYFVKNKISYFLFFFLTCTCINFSSPNHPMKGSFNVISQTERQAQRGQITCCILECGVWDLSSRTRGLNPRLLPQKHRVLIAGPPGNSLYLFFIHFFHSSNTYLYFFCSIIRSSFHLCGCSQAQQIDSWEGGIAPAAVR